MCIYCHILRVFRYLTEDSIEAHCLRQACTTYGPRKLKISCIHLVCVIESPFDWVKNKSIGPPWELSWPPLVSDYIFQWCLMLDIIFLQNYVLWSNYQMSDLRLMGLKLRTSGEMNSAVPHITFSSTSASVGIFRAKPKSTILTWMGSFIKDVTQFWIIFKPPS